MSGLSQVPRNPKFAKQEEEVLQFWKEKDCFRESLRRNKDKPAFSFYDGPPFATGTPHYGHILAGTMKDIVTRFAHMTGHSVERRFGWDCHGLPVENEIDKKLDIQSKKDVEEKYGIERYNNECRSIVMKYSSEWETVVTRMGRWIDFKRDYKTLDPTFMESVWWVFNQLNDKDLLYFGFRVMPYSWKLCTPLSNFETGDNSYQDCRATTVMPKFKIKDNVALEGTYLVAWTTTPWTLPSNLALCVNEEFVYLHIEDAATKEKYIIAEKLIGTLYPKKKKKKAKGPKYTVLKKMKGSSLVGTQYEPLFPYFKDWPNAFKVVSDNYVTDTDGTGIVHQAPAFGEDDFRVCLSKGIITKGGALACPVDPNGSFTDEVKEYKGRHVRDCDGEIAKRLKKEGKLAAEPANIVHRDKHCWRSGCQLINMAVPAWFVDVPKIQDELLKNNLTVRWVPEFVGSNRFHNWLKNARPWNISRTRYWGTPLPVWMSKDGKEKVFVRSIADLEQRAGLKSGSITDIHRDKIDGIVLKGKNGQDLHRVPDVFDCWFESGSMPYGQKHYPFENENEFKNGFPADFIAEGLDQTRGWFYTLLVLGTALFGKAPFKNVIVNGLVLAADGQKMSKSKKNYPDPTLVMNSYGSDALRLYLVTSPVVRAKELKFKQEGVRGICKDVFLPWYHAYRFLAENILRYDRVMSESNKPGFVYDRKNLPDPKDKSSNTMDVWILACLQQLVSDVTHNMHSYRLDTSTPKLLTFLENLTNWYVRFNRPRLKGMGTDEETLTALTVLFEVIYVMNTVMAPFTPFLTEYMFQNMKHVDKDQNNDSIHYLDFPKPAQTLVNEEIQVQVGEMQAVIELARKLREGKSFDHVNWRTPCTKVVIVKKDIKKTYNPVLDSYIKEQCNVKEIELVEDIVSFAEFKLEPNRRSLGKRLKRKAKAVAMTLMAFNSLQIMDFQKNCLANGSVVVAGEKVGLEDVAIQMSAKEFKFDEETKEHLVGVSSANGELLVYINAHVPKELINEGLAKDFVSVVQLMRKAAGLVPGEKHSVHVSTLKAETADILKEHKELINGILMQEFEIVESFAALVKPIELKFEGEEGKVTHSKLSKQMSALGIEVKLSRG